MEEHESMVPFTLLDDKVDQEQIDFQDSIESTPLNLQDLEPNSQMLTRS